MDNQDYIRYKTLIDDHILIFLPEVDHKSITIYDSMKYSLSSNGKRIRPILLLAACEFCGYECMPALPYACAVEYIHTYSLIHDDLPAMDNDDLRRGLPTNHKIYGDDIAILAGDGLLSSAFEAMTKDMLLYFDDPEALKRRVRAAYEISKGSGCQGMIAGQVSDVESEGKQCSKEMLDYIHLNKTAALIISSIRAGAFLSGADKQKLADLSDYGEYIGLAFQIADDLLDVCGDKNLTGKETGKDLKIEKCTYPALYGISRTKDILNELTSKAIETMAFYGKEAEFFTIIAKQLAERNK